MQWTLRVRFGGRAGTTSGSCEHHEHAPAHVAGVNYNPPRQTRAGSLVLRGGFGVEKIAAICVVGTAPRGGGTD